MIKTDIRTFNVEHQKRENDYRELSNWVYHLPVIMVTSSVVCLVIRNSA